MERMGATILNKTPVPSWCWDWLWSTVLQLLPMIPVDVNSESWALVQEEEFLQMSDASISLLKQ